MTKETSIYMTIPFRTLYGVDNFTVLGKWVAGELAKGGGNDSNSRPR